MNTENLKGSKAALLDEYKKAIDELIDLIKPINSDKLCEIIDTETKDLDCVSIQSILAHVVYSGYGYIIYMENYLGENKPRLDRVYQTEAEFFILDLQLMYRYAETFFISNPTIEIEQLDIEKKIIVNWGQQFDIEQLFEHAIVHVLRHRRQISNILNQF